MTSPWFCPERLVAAGPKSAARLANSMAAASRARAITSSLDLRGAGFGLLWPALAAAAAARALSTRSSRAGVP